MASTGPSPPTPTVNILLVDDQDANLLALEVTLEPLGQNLVRTRSGEECLRLLSRDDFAVVLLDVQMVGIDGFETARRIRSLDRGRQTPIIFLTAYESAQFPVAEAYRLGAVDYLVKPLVPDIVRAKVAVFVELAAIAARVSSQAEQLRLSEERYRLLVDNVQDYAIFMLDPEGGVLTWNSGAERIHGYQSEEIIGRHFSCFLTSEEVARGKPEYELRVAAEVGRFEDEGWRLRKDGTRFWANVIITALRGLDGRLRGFAKVTRDQTQRRRAEEQARQLAREQAARAAAEEGVRVRDRFLSIASHELRTPLNPLLIHIQMLLRAARDGSLHTRIAERVPAALEACERQVKQFTRLVNDLLDVSRIAAGRLELQREDVDLPALVREVVSRFGPELEQARCPVKVRTNGSVIGHWDRVRLDQVVTNLLSNAAKYGRGQPVEVEVGAAKDWAHLTVRDHGIGIAAEEHDRIFGRFERAVSGHEYGGLGMGLYIVRQIVAALGGKVRVASEVGKGAAFTIELPLEPSAAT